MKSDNKYFSIFAAAMILLAAFVIFISIKIVDKESREVKHKVKILKVWEPYENVKCFHMILDGDTIVGCSIKNSDYDE